MYSVSSGNKEPLISSVSRRAFISQHEERKTSVSLITALGAGKGFSRNIFTQD